MNSDKKETSNKLPFINRIINLFLILAPIIQTYGTQHYNFAFVGSLILLVLWIVTTRNISFNNLPQKLRNYFLYYFVGFFIAIFYSVGSSLSSFIPIGMIRIFLIYIMFFAAFDFDYYVKWNRRIAVVCVAFFFIQEFTFYTTGVRISGIASFLPLSLDMEDTTAYFMSIAEGKRSPSFFSESAHFAQFMIPILSIELFREHKDRFSNIFTIALFAAIVLLGSGNGLFELAAVGVVYAIHNMRSLKRWPVFIVVALLVGYVGVKYINSEKGQSVLERRETMDASSMERSSAFLRLYRGYFVYDEYSLPAKITGADNSRYINSSILNSKVAFMFGENDTYFNVAQDILLRSGIIGFILMILLFYELIKENSPAGKAVALSFVVLMFISALYFTFTMATYLCLAYSLRERHLKQIKV